jgi:hypothetical protein
MKSLYTLVIVLTIHVQNAIRLIGFLKTQRVKRSGDPVSLE